MTRVRGPYPIRRKGRQDRWQIQIIRPGEKPDPLIFETREAAQLWVDHFREGALVVNAMGTYLRAKFRAGLAESTLRTMNTRLKAYFGKSATLLVSDINRKFALSRQVELASRRTYPHILVEARRFLTWCVEQRLLEHNPLELPAGGRDPWIESTPTEGV